MALRPRAQHATGNAPWFDHYSKKKWLFVAFKYVSKSGVTPTEAVRVTCKASRPYYPYKMPSDTWESGHFRPLDLFLISTGSVQAKYSNGKTWQGSRQWSSTLDEATSRRIEGLLGKTKLDLVPANAVVTRFQNSPDANNYDFDLEFSPLTKKDSVASTSLVASGIAATALFLTMRRQVRRRHNKL